MPKRRITQQQQHQITRQQQQRLTSQHATQQSGLLITQHGKHAMVEASDGTLYHCSLRQHLGSLVAGDRVIWHPVKNQQGVITAKQPRATVLAKPTARGELKPVAANIDQVIIVIAIKPKFSTLLLDSYLVACATLDLSPLILINKCDLLTPDDELTTTIDLYMQLKYPVMYTSVPAQQGLTQLKDQLKTFTSVFVGQSGVGKSSLISYLLPHETIAIGDLSIKQPYGKHTTSTSRLYHLTGGGDLIDSPGVREFGLWHLPANQIAQGFTEFRPWLGQCKFRDCRHQQEPGCAILAAMEKQQIDPRRFYNYQQLVVQYSS
ncbi:MAG: small ribosomal subunit biogenesis GTPase RsgA [Legionellales bacterium]|nr:small ribosomal subunit biogenesis GTPase RsgA [Legionellales bacterium]